MEADSPTTEADLKTMPAADTTEVQHAVVLADMVVEMDTVDADKISIPYISNGAA
jgi:hypothetical protein